LVQEARKRGPYSNPVFILCEIRHLYIALHQGTDAAPTAFSASTSEFDDILRQPLSYPLCHIPSYRSHRPDSITVPNSHAVPFLTQPGHSSNASPYLPSHGGSMAPQQAEQVNIIVGPPLPSGPTTHGEIGDSSQPPAATSPALPVHTSPHLTNASPSGGITTALQAPPATMLSHPLEGATRQDVVGPWEQPDICEILPTASTYCDAGAASTSDPFIPASFVSVPASPTPSRAPPLPSPDLLTSVPPVAETAAAGFVRSDDPIPQIHTSKLGETSRAPVAPLIFRNPAPGPAVTPSTGPDPSDDPDAVQKFTSSAYLSHPLEGNRQQDTVACASAPGISEIPSRVNPIPRTRTDSTIISPTPPVLLAALSDSMIAAESPSSVESAPLLPDHIPPALGFLSSSLTTDISPQVASASEAQVTSIIRTPSSQDTPHDINPHIPMTVIPHIEQTAR
jgi:hypothetical protein